MLHRHASLSLYHPLVTPYELDMDQWNPPGSKNVAARGLLAVENSINWTALNSKMCNLFFDATYPDN